MEILENLKGVVIQEVNYRDNDKIITILTDRLGKISAGVPGGRSLKSKRMAACQLFCYAWFSLSQRGGHYVVSQATLIENFFLIREQVDHVALGYYLAQLAGEVTRENMESGETLRLTLNSLHLLAKRETDLIKLKAVYELRMMGLAGFMPDLVVCRDCEGADGPFWFAKREGVLICQQCSAGYEEGAITRLNSDVLAAMRFILYSEEKQVFSFQMSRENLNYLSAITEQYVEVCLDRRFSALDFFKQMMAMNT